MKKGPHYIKDRKIPTSLSIRQSLVEKIRSSNLDVSAICTSALEMALGKDPEELELEKLGTAILRKKEELAPMEARFAQLRDSVDRKRKLDLDRHLEEDCGPWYLRFLIQEGRIHAKVPKPKDLEAVFRTLAEDHEEMAAAQISSGKIIFQKAPSMPLYRRMIRIGFIFSANGLKCQLKDERPFLNPPDHECLSKLRIDFDRGMLLGDLSSGSVSGSLPVSTFRAYSPRIMDEAVKREIKSRMLPEYSNANVEVIG